MTIRLADIRATATMQEPYVILVGKTCMVFVHRPDKGLQRATIMGGKLQGDTRIESYLDADFFEDTLRSILSELGEEVEQ